MESGVNRLTNSPKILHLTKRDIFQLSLCQNYEKIGYKCSLVDFCSLWEPLIHWLQKGVLKQDLLCIQATTFFGGNNLGNEFKNSLGISDLTRREVFQVYLCRNAGKIREKCSLADFCIVLEP